MKTARTRRWAISFTPTPKQRDGQLIDTIRVTNAMWEHADAHVAAVARNYLTRPRTGSTAPLVAIPEHGTVAPMLNGLRRGILNPDVYEPVFDRAARIALSGLPEHMREEAYAEVSASLYADALRWEQNPNGVKLSDLHYWSSIAKRRCARYIHSSPVKVSEDAADRLGATKRALDARLGEGMTEREAWADMDASGDYLSRVAFTNITSVAVEPLPHDARTTGEVTFVADDDTKADALRELLGLLTDGLGEDRVAIWAAVRLHQSTYDDAAAEHGVSRRTVANRVAEVDVHIRGRVAELRADADAMERVAGLLTGFDVPLWTASALECEGKKLAA